MIYYNFRLQIFYGSVREPHFFICIFRGMYYIVYVLFEISRKGRIKDILSYLILSLTVLKLGYIPLPVQLGHDDVLCLVGRCSGREVDAVRDV